MSGTEQELAVLIPQKRKALQMLRAACALPELLRNQVLELARLRSSIAGLRARLEVCETRKARATAKSLGNGGNGLLDGGETDSGSQGVPRGLRTGDPYTRALEALLQARRHERSLLEAQLAQTPLPGPGPVAPATIEPEPAPRAPEPTAGSREEPDALDALEVFRDLL